MKAGTYIIAPAGANSVQLWLVLVPNGPVLSQDRTTILQTHVSVLLNAALPPPLHSEWVKKKSQGSVFLCPAPSHCSPHLNLILLSFCLQLFFVLFLATPGEHLLRCMGWSVLLLLLGPSHYVIDILFICPFFHRSSNVMGPSSFIHDPLTAMSRACASPVISDCNSDFFYIHGFHSTLSLLTTAPNLQATQKVLLLSWLKERFLPYEDKDAQEEKIVLQMKMPQY